MSSWSDSFVYLNDDGIISQGKPSDIDIRSLETSQSGHLQPGKQATGPEGPSLDADVLNNLSANPSSNELPSYPASAGLVLRPTPSSSAPTNDGNEASFSSPSMPDGTPEIPATSEADQRADILVTGDLKVAIPADLMLVGLELPVLDDLQPELSLRDTNNNNPPDLLNDGLDFLEAETTNPQADPYAMPWVLGTHVGQTTIGESTLAPSPGLAYIKYYSSMRAHARGHKRKIRDTKKAIQESFEAQSTSLGSFGDSTVTERPEPYSTLEEESRNKRPRYCYSGSEEYPHETLQQYQIYPAIDSVSIPSESLGFMVYPSFAFSHLYRSSLSTFASELTIPGGLSHHVEYRIGFYLGFGPAIELDVCTFIPKDKKHLQSYQKRKGEEKLYVQESLPLVLNLFSVESCSEELNTWLDETIDSDSRLQGYVEFMERRQNGELSVKILRCLVAWHSTSKSKIFRIALKLLMSGTLLSLVPKVENIPEPLSVYLSPQPSALNSPRLSTSAPKLLTRQIKASIHHIQHGLLNALSSYFTRTLRLATEVKVAMAFLVAFALDLARNAVRSFAKYASTVNSTVSVKQHDVTEYETTMETHVFDKVRSSVLDMGGKTGKLGEVIGKIVKDSGKESQGCQFVSIISDALL